MPIPAAGPGPVRATRSGCAETSGRLHGAFIHLRGPVGPVGSARCEALGQAAARQTMALAALRSPVRGGDEIRTGSSCPAWRRASCLHGDDAPPPPAPHSTPPTQAGVALPALLSPGDVGPMGDPGVV